jgi:hypothetical protein
MMQTNNEGISMPLRAQFASYVRRVTTIACALALLISTLNFVALPAKHATAAACDGSANTYWPHTGNIDIDNASGKYNAMLRFTMTANEVCSLQKLNKYLEIDFSLYGFSVPTGWDSYTLSTNLPGAIKDTAAGDPTNQPTPAPTGIDTSRLVAGKTYYVSVAWSATVIIDAKKEIIFRWIPSHWAGSASYSSAKQKTEEIGYCNIGISANNLAWCYFPNTAKAAPLFGSGSFTNGFTEGRIPIKNSAYSWSPDSSGKPVLKTLDLSVPTPRPGNKLPTANFTASRLTGTGNRIALNGTSSSDPDGSISSWTWYRDGNVIGTGSTLTYSLGSATSATIMLNVIDNGGASSSITKTISAQNRTPVITGTSPGDRTIVGSNTPTLSASAKDDDGDALQYSFRVTGPSVDISSGWTGSSWKVPASRLDPGTSYTWTVAAKDPKGATTPTATRSFTVAMLPTANELVSLSTGNGYWEVAGDGGVFSYGAAQFYGSLPGIGVHVNNIIGMARTPTDKGYWLVGKDGGVFAFGDAGFYGSLPSLGVGVNNIVGMAPTKDGRGYWLVGSDGGVFAFGNAGFFGSMGGQPLNKPVQAIAPTATSQGYWLAAEDGGVFAFGDAPFYGSMGGQHLNYPVVDIDATPDGKGYWLAAEDGGVFTFGNAGFYGSMGGQPLNGHINSMSIAPDGRGYWLNGCDGGVFAFGSAPFYGSQPRYSCRGIWY